MGIIVKVVEISLTPGSFAVNQGSYLLWTLSILKIWIISHFEFPLFAGLFSWLPTSTAELGLGPLGTCNIYIFESGELLATAASLFISQSFLFTSRCFCNMRENVSRRIKGGEGALREHQQLLKRHFDLFLSYQFNSICCQEMRRWRVGGWLALRGPPVTGGGNSS